MIPTAVGLPSELRVVRPCEDIPDICVCQTGSREQFFLFSRLPAAAAVRISKISRSSPYILRPKGFWNSPEKEVCILLLEFAEGPTLAQYVGTRKMLPQETMMVAWSVLCALAELGKDFQLMLEDIFLVLGEFGRILGAKLSPVSFGKGKRLSIGEFLSRLDGSFSGIMKKAGTSLGEMLAHPLFTEPPFATPESRGGTLSGYRIGAELQRRPSKAVMLCYRRKKCHDDDEAAVMVMKAMDTRMTKVEAISAEIVSLLRLQTARNVVRLTDFFSEEQTVYVVTEYAIGGTLEQYVNAIRKRTKTGMCAAEARAVGKQILIGIKECHERFVIHRDLHPKNILITRAKYGQAIESIKLVDFGLAALSYPGKSEDKATLYGGCDPYQVGRFCVGGCKADIWNFGLTLYFMLFGIQIDTYYRNDLSMLLKKGEYRCPKGVEGKDAETLRNIMTRCLCPDAGKRPTAEELLDEF